MYNTDGESDCSSGVWDSRLIPVTLARLNHSCCGQIFGIAAQFHSDRRRPRMKVWRILVAVQGRGTKAVAADVSLVDGLTHSRNRLNEVGHARFAQHGTQLYSLAVRGVLLAPRGRS